MYIYRCMWLDRVTSQGYVHVTCQCCSNAIKRYQITSTVHALYLHRGSKSLDSPLLTCRVNGFMKLFPYPYTFICLMMWTRETWQRDQTTCFLSIVVQWRYFQTKARCKVFCCAVIIGIRVVCNAKRPYTWRSVEYFARWHLLMSLHSNPLHICFLWEFLSVVHGLILSRCFLGFTTVKY